MLSDSLLGSVLVETACFALIFAILLLWKRPKKNAEKAKAEVGQTTSSSCKTARHGNAKSLGSLKNRKGNVMARGDLSGESTDTGKGSLRSSDTEVSSSEFTYGNFPGPCPAWFNGSFIQPLGPMAMQFPQGVQGASAPFIVAGGNGKRLSSYAEPYVPGPLEAAKQEQQQGFHPADFDGSANADRRKPWAPPDPHGDNSHDSLAKIINKLSPEDAATVMASLNAASSTTGMPVILYPHPVPMMPRSGKHREGQPQQLPRHPREARDQREPVQEARMMPKNQPPPGVNMEQYANTLKENLRQLSSLQPKTVILVRKISKLGMNSPQLLEIYFSQFGPVKKVFISHAIEKPHGRRTQPRWRPATLGFIAMENPEDAEKARLRGAEQVVLGVTIQVIEYEDHYAQQKDCENDEDENAEEVEAEEAEESEEVVEAEDDN